MGLLNPVVSKFTVDQGSVEEIYFCPQTKSHAIVDLSIFKEDTNTDTEIAVALATDSDPNNLSSVDYFIENIKLTGTNNTAEINKIIVGKGEHLFFKVISGADVNVRLSGMEENNSKILKAGRLGASTLSNTTQTQIFENTFSNAAYISSSITFFNTSSTETLNIEMWISSSATPSTSDKVLKTSVPQEGIIILENILLTPNEKIFVTPSIAGAEYFINGAIVSQQ